MCQKKPGPRCAGHLRDAIAAAETQVAENRAAFEAGADRPHPGAEAHLLQLGDEFDETPTGQKALAEQMLRSVGDPATVTRLKARKANAARRYAVKQAALAATEAGNTRGANIVLKTGNPHTAWLAQSRLNPLNSAAYARMNIDRDGGSMIGVVASSAYTEYDYEDQPTYVTESALVYETPIAAGPVPGTYLTHATPAARQSRDPYLYTEADLDRPEPALQPYSVEQGTCYSTPVTAAELTDSCETDTLLGFDSDNDYTVTWEDTPEVVRDPDGTPVLLRFHGQATGAVGSGYRSASAA